MIAMAAPQCVGESYASLALETRNSPSVQRCAGSLLRLRNDGSTDFVKSHRVGASHCFFSRAGTIGTTTWGGIVNPFLASLEFPFGGSF
jgi:hypothetical protein